MQPADRGTLRVVFVAGTLDRGGAEKQLVYQLRALRDAGAAVSLCCLTTGETHEPAVRSLGVSLCWTGRSRHPLLRMREVVARVRAVRPHVVHSAHFFTNIYAVAAARAAGAVEIGAVRNDGVLDIRDSGVWGLRQVHWPRTIVVNSEAARRNLLALGIGAESVDVVANVIDLDEFDTAARRERPLIAPGGTIVVAAGRLVAFKRFDVFLSGLCRARRVAPHLRGVIVGDGPERPNLERQARALGFPADGLTFLGMRDDVPACLCAADVVVSCSDHEGFPNVVLEAMAAGRPVIATAAGDCERFVRGGETGVVIPFNAPEALASALLALADSPDLRDAFGRAARRMVEERYTPAPLAGRLHAVYGAAAARQRRAAAALVISGQGGRTPASYAADAGNPIGR